MTASTPLAALEHAIAAIQVAAGDVAELANLADNAELVTLTFLLRDASTLTRHVRLHTAAYLAIEDARRERGLAPAQPAEEKP